MFVFLIHFDKILKTQILISAQLTEISKPLKSHFTKIEGAEKLRFPKDDDNNYSKSLPDLGNPVIGCRVASETTLHYNI